MSTRHKPGSAVVKISARSHEKLQELAQTEQRPMGEIVNDLINRYEEEQFWKRARESLARLRADPVAWQDYMGELAEWDAMPDDGLAHEEPYYTPEEEREILASAGRDQDG